MARYSLLGYWQNLYVRVTAISVAIVFLLLYKQFPDPMSIFVALLVITPSAYLLGFYIKKPSILSVGGLGAISYFVYSFIFYFFKLTTEIMVLQQEFQYGLVFGGLTGVVYWITRRR